MKKFTFFATVIIALLITACASLKNVRRYVANYSVVLSKVESPENAKQTYGETKVVTIDDNDINKYRYEDDFISITWHVSTTKFNFALLNKSNHTLKINWNDISYVDTEGKVGRVMHAGVKYVEKNNSQPPTSIPKGATISDILLPTENVYYAQYIGWKEKYLIPSFYKTQEDKDNNAQSYVGKTMQVLMPIMIEDVKNDYVFTFEIEKLIK